MAFRAPRFSYKHAFRDAAIGNASLGTGSADADFPLVNAFDDRNTLKFALSSAGALELELDLGSDWQTSGLDGFDRAIVPAGHNLDQTTLIQRDNNAGFSSPTNIGSISPVDGVMIDEVLTASTEQYIRMLVSDTLTAWELHECVLTNTMTLTRGPDMRNSVDEMRFNFTRLVQPQGPSPTISNGANQRYMELEYRDIQGADLIAMEAFVDWVGMVKNFYVDPVSFSATPETDDPPILMKFDQPVIVNHESTVPAAGVESKHYRLFLIESLD